MYKQNKNPDGSVSTQTIKRLVDNACIPFDLDNTDYQTFKTAVLEQQINSIEEHDDSFSIRSDISILKDADGNTMTIEQGKTYVRTLP
jgi:hypothetical protein